MYGIYTNIINQINGWLVLSDEQMFQKIPCSLPNIEATEQLGG